MDHVDRILSQWKQVRPDLDVAPMETVGRINRLSSLLRHEMEKTWKLHGLNAASFDRYSPDDIQIRGNRTIVPRQRELHPFRSHPMA